MPVMKPDVGLIFSWLQIESLSAAALAYAAGNYT